MYCVARAGSCRRPATSGSQRPGGTPTGAPPPQRPAMLVAATRRSAALKPGLSAAGMAAAASDGDGWFAPLAAGGAPPFPPGGFFGGSGGDGGGAPAARWRSLPQYWSDGLVKAAAGVGANLGALSTAAVKGASVWRISAMSGPDSTEEAQSMPSGAVGEKISASGGGNGGGPASGSGKLKLVSGAFMLPHPEKMAKGGEDAYFISDCGHVTGVADGVGGWAEVGVDAGAYSRLLMKNCQGAAAKETVVEESSPLRILKQAYGQTHVQGSSTACIVAMGNDTVHAANLGDSGLIIVRGERIIFKSPQQQHDFNFPFQLGSEAGMSDPPEAAAMFSVPVLEGDIVIMGTDGLFDNVFTDEIAHLAAVNKAGGADPAKSAKSIGTLAHVAAKDTEMMSPFGMAAQQVGFMFKGGKMDDITVVVSYITAVDADAGVKSKL
eukprot:jgi/Tetstr1/428547/TSEL_018541.t1